MDFVVLRLIHVVGGAFWLGAAATLFLFLQPTALATAPEGQRFMLHVLRNRHFSEVVLVDALLTGAAGAVLFWRNTNGFELELMTQPQTLGFTVGAVAGAIAVPSVPGCRIPRRAADDCDRQSARGGAATAERE